MFTFEILLTLIILLTPLTSAKFSSNKTMRPNEIITAANNIKKQHNVNENKMSPQTNKEAYKGIYDKRSKESKKWKDEKLHENIHKIRYEETDKKTNITQSLANKDMISDNGVVIEYARKHPLMFRGNYDLVSEWTGMKSEDVRSLHPKNQQFSHNRKFYKEFNPGYFQASIQNERIGKRSKENNYDENKSYRVEGMLKNNKDSENESNFHQEDDKKIGIQEPKGRKNEVLKKVNLEKNGNVIKKGGKRRHVGQNQAGWRQEWSGDGLFRGVSRCVDIPLNMSLCTGIDYGVMRVPNLLQHDTLREIIDQSSHWTPLMRLKCHRDVQIFLCSLFAPVCLETPVYPCRRTCQAVQLGCEASLKKYNFNWPEFLNCSNFPADTDLCVGLREESEKDLVETSHASSHQTKGLQNHYHHNHNSECNMCGGGLNVESFIDHYCEADVVLKTRIHSVRMIRKKLFLIRLRKSDVRIIKGSRQARALFGRRRERIKLQTEHCNCTQVVKQLRRYGNKSKNKIKNKMRKSNKRYSNIDKNKNNVKRMNKFVKRSLFDDSLSSSFPTVSSVSSHSPSSFSSSSSSSRKREKPKFLLMVRRLSGEWVVVLIQELHPNQHSLKNTKSHHASIDHPNPYKVNKQALKVIRNNQRNICNNIS